MWLGKVDCDKVEEAPISEGCRVLYWATHLLWYRQRYGKFFNFSIKGMLENFGFRRRMMREVVKAEMDKKDDCYNGFLFE